MKNKLLLSSFRKIWSTRKKFLSLLCMSLLGVGFFVGIKATSPDMTKTLDKYLSDNDVYDIEVISSLGLTEDDIEELESLDIASNVVGNKYSDEVINLDTQEEVIRIIALSDINKPILIDGDLPKNSNEIVVEEAFLNDNDLKINDTLSIESDNLNNKNFKIVGVVESPLYFTSSRGTTSVGNGQWNYYFYTLEEVFNLDYYSSIYLRLDNKEDYITNSDEYLDLVNKGIDEIEEIQKSRQDARYEELYGTYIESLQVQNIEVDENNFEYPTWYILTRSDNQAYSMFIDATESLKQIGSVFPLIFFIVAILISLISMSRMVEEERGEIGTLKGLGFSNYHLYAKNLLYAFLATFLGGIIGMFIGFNLIPNVIWNIYTSLFYISDFICEFNLYYATLGIVISLICICGACIITTHNILREKASELMRPKAPKDGKKIFLENFKFWQKLRFSTKISIRNIFRYKKRIIITIIGLAGSTALLLVGFGLRDSVTDVVDFNYSNVFVYDRIISLKNNVDDSSLMDFLDKNDAIEANIEARTEVVNLYNLNKDSLEVNLIVPQESKQLDKVIHLNDINNDYKKINISNDGIILTEKLAQSLGVESKDKVTFLIDDEYKEVEVTNIVENYINDYAYLSKETYEELFKDYQVNSIFVKVEDNYDKELDSEIMKYDSVSNLITKEDTSSLMEDILSKLNAVVVILIIASSMLAFVILYNLSSINISERKREISTLKVLGFYDEEVDAYITNENYFITIVGIAIGLFGGLYLCHYVINTCEPQYVMFVRHIKISSYIISALISIAFTFIVSRLTHINLKKIDMIESLKSNE